MTEKVDALAVRCPRCKQGPGWPCVYTAPASPHVSSEQPSVKWLYDRVGTPTKKPHGERWRAAHAQRDREHEREYLDRARAEGRALWGDLFDAREAGTEWDRRETAALIGWLREHGGILLEEPDETP